MIKDPHCYYLQVHVTDEDTRNTFAGQVPRHPTPIYRSGVTYRGYRCDVWNLFFLSLVSRVI
jgi:hypothetical protein